MWWAESMQERTEVTSLNPQSANVCDCKERELLGFVLDFLWTIVMDQLTWWVNLEGNLPCTCRVRVKRIMFGAKCCANKHDKSSKKIIKFLLFCIRRKIEIKLKYCEMLAVNNLYGLLQFFFQIFIKNISNLLSIV